MEVGDVLAAIFVILATFANAFETISCQYLEEVGESWYQLTLFAESTYLILVMIYWIVIYSYKYYIVTKTTNTSISYMEILLSVFPSRNNDNIVKIWVLLGVRGTIGAILSLLQIASLQYIDSGDSTLIQTVAITLTNFLFGILFFHEEKSVILFVSLFFCIVGLILVCQPSFIFDLSNTQYSTISFVGFILAAMAGIGRAISNIISKESYKYGVHWLALVIAGAFVSVFIDIIVFIAAINIFDGVYWRFKNYNLYYVLLTVSVGLWIGLCTAFFAIGFQIGDISKLGILSNSDIIFIYCLQYLILKEHSNFITYIGALVVLVVCCVIFFHNWKKSQSRALSNTNARAGLDDSYSYSYSYSGMKIESLSDNDYTKIDTAGNSQDDQQNENTRLLTAEV